MSQDLYKEKYVKYKSKYLSLKNIEGAGIFDKMLPGRYFFYVPHSVFNMIAAYIFLNQLTKSTSSKGKTSATVVSVPSATAASATTQSTTVQPAPEQPTSQEEIYIEGLPSDVLFNIINKDNKPSYRISLGDKTYINLKDDTTFNAFDDTAKKFGYSVTVPTVPTELTKMQKLKKTMSDKFSDLSTETVIEEDIALLKKKINIKLSEQKIENNYKLIHYEVKKIGSNVIYATEYSTSKADVHPITSHLIKMKQVIENVL